MRFGGFGFNKQFGFGGLGAQAGSDFMPDFFIDASTGNDANDGTGALAAWQTTAALLTYAASNDLSGKKIGFARGGTYAPFDLALLDVDDCTVGAYLTGDRPYFDCTEAIPASWTLHAAGVYKVTLTRANIGDAKLYGNYFRNGTPMRKVASVATLSGKGDNVVFAENETTTTVTLYMNSAADPGADGAAYRWSKYGSAIRTGGRRNIIQDIWAHGPAHQDGSLVPVGDGGDKSTLGGNILRRCRMDWGARHSAVVGSGSFTSIAEYCEFNGAANDVETGTVLNASGTSNGLVFNSPDHTTATCISRFNTYNGMGYPNYNAGTANNFTGPYGHDGVANRLMVAFSSIGDTFIDTAEGVGISGTTTTVTDPHFQDPINALRFNGNDATATLTGATGNINRLFGEATVTGCSLTVRNCGTALAPIIIKDCGQGGAAFAYTMQAGSTASIDLDVEDCYLHIQGIRLANTSRKLIALRAGELRWVNNVVTPKLAPPIELMFDLATGVTIHADTDGNTYPKGTNWQINTTVYRGLTAWKAATSRDTNSIHHTLPTPEISFDFTGADANFETLPGVTRLNGVAGALQRKSNQLSATSTTQSIYTTGDVSSASQYCRSVITGIAAGGPGATLGVVDATNMLIVRQTTTAHQIQSMIAGSFLTPVNSTAVTPAVGQEVIGVKYDYVDPDTGASSLRVSLVVNDGLIAGLQLVSSASIQSEVTVGAVARGTITDPLLDNLQYGPASLAA